jgi:hypothetical protein
MEEFKSSLHGLILIPDNNGVIKKRYRVIKIGNDYLIHKKTYKRMARSKRALNRIARRLTTREQLPSLDIDWLPRPALFDGNFTTEKFSYKGFGYGF